MNSTPNTDQYRRADETTTDPSSSGVLSVEVVTDDESAAEELTDRHLAVIDCLIIGMPIATISRELHIARSTIYAWRREQAFVSEESRRRAYVRLRAQDDMVGLLEQALGVLRRALANDDVDVAVKVLKACAPDRAIQAVDNVRILGSRRSVATNLRSESAGVSPALDAKSSGKSARRRSTRPSGPNASPLRLHPVTVGQGQLGLFGED